MIEIIWKKKYVYYQFRFVRRADLFPLQLGKVYGLEERLVAHVSGVATGDSQAHRGILLQELRMEATF